MSTQFVTIPGVKQVLVIDPPTKEFVRAISAHNSGNSEPDDFDGLKGGIDREVRHITPKMSVLVEVIMVCYEDGIRDRSRLSYILCQRFGYFPPAKSLSKAINRVKALRESQLIIPTRDLKKLES